MKTEKDSGTTTTNVPSAVPAGVLRGSNADPLKFYSERDPWKVVRCDDGTLIVCSAGDVICHSDPNHGRDDPADLALFPMLAAAPEMLRALDAALGQWHSWALQAGIDLQHDIRMGGELWRQCRDIYQAAGGSEHKTIEQWLIAVSDRTMTAPPENQTPTPREP